MDGGKTPNEAYRAAYPPDAPAPADPWREDGGVPYPDMVYEAEREDPFPREPGPDFRDDDAIFPAPAASAAQSGGTGMWALIAAVCALVLAGMLFYVAQLRSAYGPFREKVSAVMGDTIAPGVSVDGINVGGLTKSAAAALLDQNISVGAGVLNITLQVDGKVWIITERELPLLRDVQSALDTAWSIGRQGSSAAIGSNLTPFEYRYRHLYHTAQNPVILSTAVTYDHDRLRELVGLVEAYVNEEAVDAQVASFDYVNRAFSFSDERAGVKLDGDGLYRRIVQALDGQQYNAIIYMSTAPVMPRVTKAELINSFTRISSFTTRTTADENRNSNVYLAARAVSGTAVMPGETFSFNAATGERTPDKGYLPAAAIADGTTVEEVGGGVCQVSSTLFNAAAMADMTIVARSPHTWPSNYVEKGLDATVNWPNLDFQFRNDRSTPVFIVAWYQEGQCTVEIYGASLGPGVSIQLVTRLISVTEPPEEPEYVYNPDLQWGEVREKKKARTGYEVETYRVYLTQGVETGRQLLCTSQYQAIRQVLEYNYEMN